MWIEGAMLADQVRPWRLPTAITGAGPLLVNISALQLGHQIRGGRIRVPAAGAGLSTSSRLHIQYYVYH